MIELKKVLGKRIREARDEKGITQKDLAEFLGYSPMGISHFENGIRNLKISDVQKLSQFFNKDLSYFLQPDTTLFRASSNQVVDVETAMSDFDNFLNEKGF